MNFSRPQIAPITVALAALIGAILWLGVFSATSAEARSWVRIKGDNPIPAAKSLRYEVFCAKACKVDVTARVVWPNRPALVNRLQGRLRAGENRANIITLNPVALNLLRANYRRSRLRVTVVAKDRRTGATRTVRRSFRFSYTP